MHLIIKFILSNIFNIKINISIHFPIFLLKDNH